jgi:hypothetical protein
VGKIRLVAARQAKVEARSASVIRTIFRRGKIRSYLGEMISHPASKK